MTTNLYGATCIFWVPTKRDDLKSFCEFYDMLTNKCDYWLKGGNCETCGLLRKDTGSDGDGLLLHG